MFSGNFEKVLSKANQLAIESGHSCISLEHLLYVLLETHECIHLFQSLGASRRTVKEKLHNYLTALPKDNTDTHLQESDKEIQLEYSDEFKRVIQRAIFHAQALGRSEVNSSYVLIAILSEPHTTAYQTLHDEGINKVVISHMIQDVQTHFDIILPTDNSIAQESSIASEEPSSCSNSMIQNYTINMNELARKGQIDPVYERSDEIYRVEKILCRRRKNNPLLVGEPGVGKTAIAEGLAHAIVHGKVNAQLKHVTVYALDLGAMLAGTKYRGDFEKRFKAVLNEFCERDDAIMFVDEIHSIIGAGASSGGSLDAANLMKPLLSRGRLRCIGATTYQEFKQFFDKDKALSRRFQKIDVTEPNAEQTMHILKSVKHKFEEHHDVVYSLNSLKTTLELSMRYLHNRFLPDKALDVLDEAGSAKSLSQNQDDKQKKKAVVDSRDIEKIVAEMARIPRQNINLSEKKQLVNLERDLKMFIYGQEKAIAQITSAIKLSRSGLSDPNKPVGSFMFAGPTGVGKTELAKQLAKILNLQLLRFDMSEYMDKHASSQLIGAPAGYVGFDQGGHLTEAIIKNPYSVLLLDEIEKAHPDLLNLLLQVMDRGQLTDNTGRIADFRHVIIIMTSNAGAGGHYKNTVGFVKSAQDNNASTVDNNAIEGIFSPEFRNRLNAIVPFNALSEKHMQQVVDKFISELEVTLAQQHIELILEPKVRSYLAHKGFDRKNGARPMARLIDSDIKKPIADALLVGTLKHGDKACIAVKNDTLCLQISKKTVAANS